jgi:hypothetical protein
LVLSPIGLMTIFYCAVRSDNWNEFEPFLSYFQPDLS